MIHLTRIFPVETHFLMIPGVFAMNNPESSRRKFLVRGMVSLAALPFAGVK